MNITRYDHLNGKIVPISDGPYVLATEAAALVAQKQQEINNFDADLFRERREHQKSLDELEKVRAQLSQAVKERDEARKFPDIGPDPLAAEGEQWQAMAEIESVLERIRKAMNVQQKEVPDQTALVWRIDLSRLISDYITATVRARNWLEDYPNLKQLRDETVPGLRTDLSAAHAQIARMREALTQIANCGSVFGPNTLAGMAAEALTATGKDGQAEGVQNAER